GEVLLKFGERAAALACFEQVLTLGFQDDHDLMLQIGRALFREGVLDQARRFFEGALRAHPDSADAAACVGYAAHRLADEGGSLHWLRRALELDSSLGEARIYLANLLYDRGEYEAALFHLERTGPEEHYDALAIWRLVELKKSVYRLPDDDPELVPWNERLNELAGDAAPEDLLLAEIEAMTPDGQIRDPRQLELFGTLLTELQGMKNKSFELHVGVMRRFGRNDRDRHAHGHRGSPHAGPHAQQHTHRPNRLDRDHDQHQKGTQREVRDAALDPIEAAAQEHSTHSQPHEKRGVRRQ